MNADALYPNDHYLHNQQFLIYVLSSLGQYRRAVQESRALMDIPENPREREALLGSSARRTGWFALMRVLVRFEKWDEILDGKTLPLYDKPWEAAWYHWARGIALASKADAAAAKGELQAMERELARVRQLSPVMPYHIHAARAELESLQRAAAIEEELIYSEPPSYPRPVLERVGRAALADRKFSEAEQAYRKLLTREPGSGRALWGLAESLRGAGKTQEAERVMKEFEKAWANADPDVRPR
jgi:tetratricopeptide (TPR) repeat protein